MTVYLVARRSFAISSETAAHFVLCLLCLLHDTQQPHWLPASKDHFLLTHFLFWLLFWFHSLPPPPKKKKLTMCTLFFLLFWYAAYQLSPPNGLVDFLKHLVVSWERRHSVKGETGGENIHLARIVTSRVTGNWVEGAGNPSQRLSWRWTR